jgi:putative oxidoreductase
MAGNTSPRRTPHPFLQVLRDIALLVARIGLGGILIAHGWRRWQHLGVRSQIDYLRQFGTPYPEVAAYGATLLELVGGIFLIVGALTPLVALAVLVQQVLTISYTNYFRGRYLTDLEGNYVGGYEYNVALGVLALVFVVFGAGRASVDQLFRRTPSEEDDEVEADNRAPSHF